MGIATIGADLPRHYGALLQLRCHFDNFHYLSNFALINFHFVDVLHSTAQNNELN